MYLGSGIRWAIRVIFLFLITAAWIAFTRWWFPPIVEGVKTLAWTSVKGRLLSAQATEPTGRGKYLFVSRSKGPHMSVRYWFVPREEGAAGRYWEGERFSAFDDARADVSWPLFERGHVEEAMRNPDRLRVHYDPANPARAVLSRGIATETLYLTFLWLPLSMLAWHCWRHVLAPGFWESVWNGLWNPAALWLTRITIAMAALGLFGFVPLYALAWEWGYAVPAEAFGLALLAFLVALARPRIVAIAFSIHAVQLFAVALFAGLMLGSLYANVMSGYQDHQRVVAGEPQSRSVRYVPPFEQVRWAMSTPYLELHRWGLDVLRRHPQGERQIPIIRQSLKSEDRGTRTGAIRVLTTMNPAEVDTLVADFAPLLEDDDKDVRQAALFVVQEWVCDPTHVACDPRPAGPLSFEPLMAPLLRLRDSADHRASNQADRLLRHISYVKSQVQQTVPGNLPLR